MAGVSVESKGGGRRSVDSQVNMVPMIDLLISVIAFLLMTAVWVQTGALRSEQPRRPSGTTSAPPLDHLKVAITADGFRVGTTQMDMRSIARSPQQLDALRSLLADWHRANGSESEVQIQPDSTVPYDDIVRVMDVIYDVWSQGRPPREPLSQAVRVQLM
jgi:biopolymer transport protein ExbD